MDDLESSGFPLVDAALSRLRERNDERFRALDDAWIVQAEIERRQSAVLKEHGKWLEEHEQIFTRVGITLAEITDKLNALIDREMRRDGLT